jgi:lipopolysaccharide transport system permease protein
MAATATDEWIENRPSRGLRGVDLRELWRYRELAGFLALRDLKVRYKQAIFGAAWAIVQPLAGVAVFTLVFRRLAHVPSAGVAYPLFSFVGLVVWMYLSTSVTRATQSLVNNSALVTKVYFPRLVVPIGAVLPGLLDLIVGMCALVVLIPIFGAQVTWGMLTVPLWILALVAVALGAGTWLGTLNVKYRDVNQAISLLVQLWLFISPIAYASSSVPARWRLVYFLNPMSGVVEGFRWSLLGTPWPGAGLWVSLAVTLLTLVGGVLYFQAVERRFADVI